ncbi:hypothetical protein [Nitrospirillum bahiense]|uniref:Uncharacterized protein n=1 Tax=Nitrospirillum amazonense TaxID=28077 RepID=A0A560G9A2_9PROT|nr:hypothetical protein [Nitrospirillum amazonense]TWB30485.1 hypothetical protein FBZ88_10250 [Nitrospirillum amazonense]
MPLSHYTDPMVFALALAQAPQVRGIRHAGHFNLLVSWMRARVDDGYPAWSTVRERVQALYRDFLVVADLHATPPRWHDVGWSAGNLLASRFDISANLPGAPAYHAGKMAVATYDEIPSRQEVLGLLALPVLHIQQEKPISVMGVFMLAPKAERSNSIPWRGGERAPHHRLH